MILPSFRESAEEALMVARRAEEVGVDGVFCYDHLWPMGQPDRPALAPLPLLGLVAVSTERVFLGTLVARIGLLPDAVLLDELGSLATLAPGRVIAGLGTGDHLSAAENEAYGLPFAPAATRRASVRRCARTLRDLGLPVWIGGGSERTVAIAEEERVAVNLWGASAAKVAEQSTRSEVTWAGPLPKAGPPTPPVAATPSAITPPATPSAATPAAATRAAATPPATRAAATPPGRAARATSAPVSVEAAIGAEMRQLAEAGATWVVYPWPAPLEAMVGAAEAMVGAAEAMVGAAEARVGAARGNGRHSRGVGVGTAEALASAPVPDRER